jgi:hypothetical protein
MSNKVQHIFNTKGLRELNNQPVPCWLSIIESTALTDTETSIISAKTQNADQRIYAQVTVYTQDIIQKEYFVCVGIAVPHDGTYRKVTQTLTELCGLLSVDKFTGRVNIVFNNELFKFPSQTWEQDSGVKKKWKTKLKF